MDVFNWHEALLPYEQAVTELTAKFNGLSDEYEKSKQHSPIDSVYGRVKSVVSILDKANRKHIPLDAVFEKMEDIAGMRIVTRFAADIQVIIELLRKRSDHDLKIIEERDYITNKKPSGYKSYHMLCKYTVMGLNGGKEVWVEIQIRTLAMNFWAIIEHSLIYKYNGNIPLDIKRRLLNAAEAAYALDNEMSMMHGEIKEAQKVILVRKNIVDGIVAKLRNLYYIASIEQANDLNRQFIDLYQECDIDKLTEFDEKLTVIARLCKAEYV